MTDYNKKKRIIFTVLVEEHPLIVEKKIRKCFNGHNDNDQREIAFSFDSFFDCPCCPIWLAFCVCKSCSFSSYSLSLSFFFNHADGRWQW